MEAPQNVARHRKPNGHAGDIPLSLRHGDSCLAGPADGSRAGTANVIAVEHRTDTWATSPQSAQGITFGRPGPVPGRSAWKHHKMWCPMTPTGSPPLLRPSTQEPHCPDGKARLHFARPRRWGPDTPKPKPQPATAGKPARPGTVESNGRQYPVAESTHSEVQICQVPITHPTRPNRPTHPKPHRLAMAQTQRVGSHQAPSTCRGP